MATAVVGGAFLSAFLQVLFDRMAKREFLNLFRERKNDDQLLKKLKRNLLAVRTVLNDAENKESRDQDVKDWLDELKDTVYEADNLLDQLHTEALRVKIETEYQSSVNQVAANTCTSHLCKRHRKIKPNSTLIKNIMTMIEKVVITLDDFIQKINVFGLEKADHQLMTNQQPRPHTTSLIDESAIYGRDDDKKKIVEVLLSEDTSGGNFTVVPIVGIGGLGKTTLAQLVYNDVRVKNHFSTKAWVCVSEAYDATRITKELLAELNISVSDSSENFNSQPVKEEDGLGENFNSQVKPEAGHTKKSQQVKVEASLPKKSEQVKLEAALGENFNSLQVKLEAGLTKKRFLLVLDDVWNSDYNDWDNLRIPFKGGLRGSKIIVTTRDQKVALMMAKEECIHHMGLISEEHCWSLFEKHAFENKDGNQNLELEKIGKKIVKKCGRLPLAVKTVAGLLRSKITTKEWEDILSSEVWSQSQGGILPALRLSYIHLPSHLKRCFAYCAVFPKDYNFTKENVIQLWLANDLLEHPRDNRRAENMGEECLHELILRSLFQQSHDNFFTMHDIVNDLARSVSGEYCLRLEDYQQGHGTIARLKFFSYIHSSYDTFAKFKQLELEEAKELRTFQPLSMSKYSEDDDLLSSKILHDMLPSFKSLRVLSLCHYGSIKKLPNSFNGLKQLRYLDLSFTSIRKLPKWICTLYNLQTLLLDHCKSLEELPADLGKLINLCYLHISGISLEKMPIQMGRLRNLRVLTAFVVGKDNGSTIVELGKFSKLQGELFLSGLENVSSGRDASKAMMKDKKQLEDLTLEWKDNMNESPVARNVLDSLEPHSRIKHLRINGYCGTSLSNWLKSPSFCHMKSLRLYGCKHCIDLPTLGQLPALESLEIIGLSNITALSKEIYGNSREMKPFPSLKILKIERMQELERWDIPECEVFSNLEELHINYCPQLVGNLPKQLSSLKILKISECDKLVLKDGILSICNGNIQPLSSLNKLEISSMKNLEVLGPELYLLASLKKLSIRRCGSLLPNLELENCGQGGSLLESLELYHCDSLKIVSLGSFPTLKEVEIHYCKSIEMLSIPPPPGIQSGNSMTSLQSLYISNCHGLISFAKGGFPAPNLINIEIWACMSLRSLPKRMDSLLPSLQRLSIIRCPEIECFPEGGLPSTLQSLCIWECENLLKSPRQWVLQRLSSLKDLIISPIDDKSFPNNDWPLPCMLEFLYLNRLKNMKMLNYSGLQPLTSLQYLYINDSPLLQSLPNEGLPASLTELKINNCPRLKPMLKWEKGRDWPKVAHIPVVLVDDELVP